jgi:hypothetical protein
MNSASEHSSDCDLVVVSQEVAQRDTGARRPLAQVGMEPIVSRSRLHAQ